MTRDTFARERDRLRISLYEFAGQAAERESGLLRLAFEGPGSEISDATRKALRDVVDRHPFLGLPYGSHWRGIAQGQRREIARTLGEALAAGESAETIVQRIGGTAAARFEDGVLARSRRSLSTVVRGSVGHASVQAREAVHAANAEIVRGEQWLATLDRRTCPICMGLDSKVFDIGDGPRPPRHVGCRCVTAPLLRGESPAEVPTYQKWLTGQPARIQDIALGPTRGRLFRSGDLQVRDFVDRRGELLTLKDLRRSEPELFTKAGSPAS